MDYEILKINGMFLNGVLLAMEKVGAGAADGAADKGRTILELLFDGGILMIPIILLSIFSIYIFIERWLTIGKASKGDDAFLDRVKELVSQGQLDEAKQLCINAGTPISRMILKGLERVKVGSDLKSIEVSIENVGKIEINRLEKNLSSLATISGAAPMIGFLGTVIGMIDTFMQLDTKEQASTSDLAGGIYVALVTTVAGLVVGIIAYMAYNFLASKIQKIIHRMEYSSVEFIDLLHEPGNK